MDQKTTLKEQVLETDGEDFIVAPVPALVAVLLDMEGKKGAPLTEAEVLDIRNKAACIVPRDAHAALIESRGYDDVEPGRAWEEWSEIKLSFYGEAGNP